MIGLILIRDELTIDYRWDETELAIPEDVYCLCNKEKCRLYLMRAKKGQPIQRVNESASTESRQML